VSAALPHAAYLVARQAVTRADELQRLVPVTATASARGSASMSLLAGRRDFALEHIELAQRFVYFGKSLPKLLLLVET